MLVSDPWLVQHKMCYPMLYHLQFYKLDYGEQGPKWNCNNQDLVIPDVYMQFLSILVSNDVGFSIEILSLCWICCADIVNMRFP